MSAVHYVLAGLESIVAKLQPSSQKFTCADCDIQDRCGRMPSDDCPDRLEQIERDPTGHRRQLAAIVRAQWPLPQ